MTANPSDPASLTERDEHRIAQIENHAKDVLRRRGEDDPPFVSVADVEWLIAKARAAEVTEQLLRSMIRGAMYTHPLPWRVEQDWCVSVESPIGRVFSGTQRECDAIVALHERVVADDFLAGEELRRAGIIDAEPPVAASPIPKPEPAPEIPQGLMCVACEQEGWHAGGCPNAPR